MRKPLPTRQKQVVRLLVLLIVAGLSLLAYKIDAQYLWTDEVFSYEAAQAIAETGTPILDSGLEYNRAPIYHRILGYLFGLGDSDILLGRLLNILFVALTSIGIYLAYPKDSKVKRLLPIIFLLFSVFTVVLVREVRMYALSTALFTWIVVALSRGLVRVEEDRGWWIVTLFDVKLDMRWLATAAILLLWGIYNHVLVLASMLGLAVYVLFSLLIKRKNLKFNGLLVGLMILGVPLLSYLLLGDPDPREFFAVFTPDWGSGGSPIYYLVLLARNLSWLLVIAPILLWAGLKEREDRALFFNITILTYILYLSLQGAMHERYIQLIIPILLLQSVRYVYQYCVDFYKTHHKTQVNISLLYAVISLLVILNGYQVYREYNEIDSYRPESLSQHKKLQFNALALELEEVLDEESELIADFHSAFTLHSMGFEVSKIIIEPDNDEYERGKLDAYLAIPFVLYGDELVDEINDPARDIVVIRDGEDFKIDSYSVLQISGFARPQLFVEE